MKLGQIMQASAVIGKLYSADPVLDGEKHLKLKKAIRAIKTEIEGFEEARNAKVKATGSDKVDQNHPAFPKIVEFLNQMLGAEVKIKIEAILTEEDMDLMKLSIADQDALIKIGLAKG